VYPQVWGGSLPSYSYKDGEMFVLYGNFKLKVCPLDKL
jgi:hypothetical protein